MTMMAALMGLVVTQTGPAAPPPLQVAVPTIPGVAPDPACGGRPGLNTIATCFITTQAAIEGVVEVMNTDFASQGWLAADGRDNRIVYVKRRPEGGCDAFQILAFAGDSRTIAPAAPAHLALAAIPSDICAAATTLPAAPATPPAQ